MYYMCEVRKGTIMFYNVWSKKELSKIKVYLLVRCACVSEINYMILEKLVEKKSSVVIVKFFQKKSIKCSV